MTLKYLSWTVVNHRIFEINFSSSFVLFIGNNVFFFLVFLFTTGKFYARIQCFDQSIPNSISFPSSQLHGPFFFLNLSSQIVTSMCVGGGPAAALWAASQTMPVAPQPGTGLCATVPIHAGVWLACRVQSQRCGVLVCKGCVVSGKLRFTAIVQNLGLSTVFLPLFHSNPWAREDGPWCSCQHSAVLLCALWPAVCEILY